MVEMVISEIWVYPIKSLGGVSIRSAQITKRGLAYDRRWMLVDENAMFLTQRNFPEMALLQVRIEEKGLKVYYKLKEDEFVNIPFDAVPQEEIRVQIWEDQCDAYTIDNEIDKWFSSILNQKCRLVYMPDNSLRQLDIRYAEKGEITSFADGYPILIIGEAALEDLNNRLTESVSMNRFRPNLVFKGGIPNEEDTWKEFQIGKMRFRCVKPCARCTVTTIDQSTGVQGKEPLRTLATYRKVGQKILFGQNIIPNETGGKIYINDEITVLKS